ncbi:MAG: glycosyltransferase family 4 protein [Reyranellales bacterium]
MNFLFFAGGTTVTGMEVVLLPLMARLNEIGHRAVGIVSGWNNGDYPGMLRASGIEYHEVELGRLYLLRPKWTRGTLESLPSAIAQIREIAAAVRPDWMILGEAQSLLLCTHILPHLKTALYLHSKPERLFANYFVGRSVCRRIDRLICVSEFVARCARETPLRRAEMAIVPNGIPIPKGEWPVSDNRPIRLGIVGNLNKQKQHLMLLQAIERLKRRMPAGSFRLLIIGDKQGRFANTVEAKIAELGVQDVVSWAGFVRNRDDIYGNLDIVVAPAIDEGFGLTVVEAAAYCRPVVAARSGAFPEVVEDGRTGLLFEPGDIDGLALALERLIVDGALRRHLGRAARTFARATFTVDRMAEGFVAALEGTGLGKATTGAN